MLGQEERNDMKAEKITLAEKFEKLKPGDYAIGIVAKMNNYEIKVVRFKGVFVWHSHAEATGSVAGSGTAGTSGARLSVRSGNH